MVRTVVEDGEEFYANCEGINTDFAEVGVANEEDYLCWVWQGSGTERTSPFLAQQRTNPSFQAKDRRAVNFVFQPLSRTPVFTK